MQQPILISASQLATFSDCPRKWAYDKIDNRERGDTPATVDGKLIHKQVEDWYRDGTAPERPEAKALLAHLPDRADYLEPELAFNFCWPGLPVLVRGFIDLVDPKTDTVFDHKTARDIKRSAKTPQDLLQDAQGVLYGVAYRTVYGAVPNVNLQWTYVKREQPKTRAPATEPIRVVQTIADVEAGLARWSPVVEELYQIRTKHTKAADVPANRSACYKYGPCQHRDVCLDFSGRDKPAQEEQPMDAATLALLKSVSNTNPAPAKQVPPPNPGHATPKSILEPPTPVKDPPEMDRLAALRADFGAKPAINPPDAQPNVSPTEPPPPPVETAPVPKARKRASTKAAPTPAPTATPTEAVTDFDLEAFVDATITRAAADTDLLVQLEAARIGMELLKYRSGGK